MIGWALRWTLLCCGIALLAVGLLDHPAALLPDGAVRSRPEGQVGGSPPASGQAANTIVYTANQQGHVVLDTAVNGFPDRRLKPIDCHLSARIQSVKDHDRS